MYSRVFQLIVSGFGKIDGFKWMKRAFAILNSVFDQLNEGRKNGFVSGSSIYFKAFANSLDPDVGNRFVDYFGKSEVSRCV